MAEHYTDFTTGETIRVVQPGGELAELRDFTSPCIPWQAPASAERADCIINPHDLMLVVELKEDKDAYVGAGWSKVLTELGALGWVPTGYLRPATRR